MIWRSSFVKSRVWMWPCACLGLVVLVLVFRGERARVFAGVNDFMGIYAGARLVGSPEQFSADAYIREQVRATGWAAPSILFTRLPAFAALVRPLGKMKYLHAYVLWQICSLLALIGFCVTWPASSRLVLLLAVCWSYPLFSVFSGGQDITFLLLILAASWRLSSSRPFLAGAVLALLTVKFHLFLLLPIFLIAQKRWRLCLGAGLATAVILAMCFVVAGANWVPEYARFCLQEQTNPNALAMPNLRGLFDGLPYSAVWETGSDVLVAIAVGFTARRMSFSAAFSTALAGSLLTSHHAYAADAAVLLPASLVLARETVSPMVRLLCGLLLSPLPFLVWPRVPLVAPVPILLAALMIASVMASWKDPDLASRNGPSGVVDGS